MCIRDSKNNGYPFPVGRITVNLAPANLRKSGTIYDLPICCLLYTSVEKTVSELTDRPVLPTWYPPGSSVVQVERHTVENGYYCVVVFSLDGQEFLLSVEIYDTVEDLPTHQYEMCIRDRSPYS